MYTFPNQNQELLVKRQVVSNSSQGMLLGGEQGC